MLSAQDVCSQIERNEASFYSFILDNPTKDYLGLALEAFRLYFSAADRQSITFEINKNIVGFDSKNQYLSRILTTFFRNGQKDLIEKLVSFIKGNEKNLSDGPLEQLHKLIEAAQFKKDKAEALSNLQDQIISKGSFNKDILKHFAPEQNFETILKTGYKFAFGYKTSYMLLEDQIKYIAWAASAMNLKVSRDNIQDIPGMYSIHNIQLHEEYLQDGNYFSFSPNTSAVLEALHTTYNLKAPAFLICSNGRHWATLALVREGDELHILEFNSNKGSMLDGFALQLKNFMRRTNLFKTVTRGYKFPIYVQHSNNCGLASAAFISTASSLAKLSITDMKEQLHKDFCLDTGNMENSCLKLVHEAIHYMLGEGRELLHFEYNKKMLYNFPFQNLDTSKHRYNLYYQFENVLNHKLIPATKEQSLLVQIGYACYTALTIPAILINGLIYMIQEIAFMAYCAVSDKPLKDMAIRYCNEVIMHENARQDRETPLPDNDYTNKIFRNLLSPDLYELVNSK